MRKLAVLTLVLAAAVMLSAQTPPGGGTGGGRGGRAGGGRGGAAMMLESDWAFICFELKVDKKTYDKLWAIYQQAWTERKDIVAQMQQGSDPEALMQQLATVQEELDKAQAQVLSPEQLKQLETLRAERRSAWQGQGQRGRGQGQGQGQR
jgi:Spy/CpxP family protein refolding chaperone